MKLKTFLLGLLILLVGAGAGILIFIAATDAAGMSSNTSATGTTLPAVSTEELQQQDQPESENAKLLRFADSVLRTLRSKDYAGLAGYIHPEKGLTFVPYSTVNTTANLRFSPEETAKLKDDKTKRIWGIYDGSGESIELTAGEYFDKFVYNADYLNAPQVGINSVLHSGNSLENVAEIYPDASFVEYHFSGFDPQYEGMDWCSLKIVAEKHDGQWKLIALIHSQWTI